MTQTFDIEGNQNFIDVMISIMLFVFVNLMFCFLFFLFFRAFEDFVTWVDTSKIKATIAKYHDKLDDYALLGN